MNINDIAALTLVAGFALSAVAVQRVHAQTASASGAENISTPAVEVIAFGDSFIAREGATKGHDFVSDLSGLIGKHVLNLGVGGDTTNQGISRLGELDGYQPTTGLLAAGTMSLGESSLAGAAESSFSIQSTQVKRVRFHSRRSFDEVLQRLRQLVPIAITPDQYPAAMAKAGGVNLESFEKVVRSRTEQTGFMLFAEFDYHQFLGLYGIQRKLARLILGNPVIAVTMIRHDLEAALFAPVELLLVEDENHEGVTVIYDLPSSLMVTRENTPLLEAATALDAKLKDLVIEVTEGS